MPHGLPAASVITHTCNGITDEGRSVFVEYQSHVQILHKCADNDGWNGEIWCRINGVDMAIEPQNLRLQSSTWNN